MSRAARGSLAAGAGPYPDSPVAVDRIFTMHGVRMARLILHPLTVVSASGEVEFRPSLTVQVRFDHAGAETATATVPNPADPFDQILANILINPEQGRLWRSTDPIDMSRAAITDTNPFVGTDQWIAIRTREEGVVAVTAADFRSGGITPATLDPRNFRLFAGSGRQLSTLMSSAPPGLRQVPIRIIGEADGTFDETDSLLFWAQGLNRWEPGDNGRPIDVVHRYDRDNVYWLAAAGDFAGPPLRLTATAAPPLSAATDRFAGTSRARHEEDHFFRVNTLGYTESYYTWYWRNQRVGSIALDAVHDPVAGAPAMIEFGTFAGFAGRDPARLVTGGVNSLPTRLYPGTGEDRSTISQFDLSAFDPAATFVLAFDSTPSSNYYLDYYSIEYQRRLDCADGAVEFLAPDTNGTVNFILANAADADVWDVTDPAGPFALSSLAVDGSTTRFGTVLAQGARRVFFAARPSQRLRPQSLQRVTTVDLHTPATGADYVAIGPRAFAAATGAFLDYRAVHDGLRTRFVALEDVYNSFSLGVADPVAIRRFLRQCHFGWPSPAPVYALLVGDGSNDYLDRTGARSVNYVPPYIVRDDNVVSDESYVYFSDAAVLNAVPNPQDNPFPDMLIGRWPVRTQAEIGAVTAKVRRYESTENLGPWRSRIMMVADDEFGDRNLGSVRETFHINDAEQIARTTIPGRFDLEKIYLTEYPFNNPGCNDPSARGCTKPMAKEAIIAGLNDGVAVFDYLGHGNPDLLAHEHVFERVTDLPRLVNATTPTAVLTFSCSIGLFDDPVREGMSEEWFRMSPGGAVAVVSATRLAAALANADLNEEVFNLLFTRGITGIGAAVYTGKLRRQYFEPSCRLFSNCQAPICPCQNDRGYVLFGDPAMRLGIPDLRVQFDTVQPESLSALALTRVAGCITDTAGTLQSGFDGEVSIIARDVDRHRVHAIDATTSIEYDLAGGTLYRGRVPVQGGRFAFGFIVPKDIAYGERGARIMGHAAAATRMANGSVDSLWLSGTAIAPSDTSGPQVRLETTRGEPIVDGFTLAEGSGVVVMLSDPSGINLSGAPGHRLLVTVNDGDRPFADLTDVFTYDPGVFDRGRADVSLAGLAKGSQRLTVTGWDNANNSTRHVVDVTISSAGSADEFRVTEFLNYPNPFSERTTFYFRATREVRRAKIRIFTVAGRLIWETGSARDGEVEWNGRDAAGDPVGNGVYLAQLEVTGQLVSSQGKVVDKRAYREAKLVVSR
ncbi:MAG: type IX secretion system sortase PorU [Candidatus Zixiibacteriota bacterium]